MNRRPIGDSPAPPSFDHTSLTPPPTVDPPEVVLLKNLCNSVATKCTLTPAQLADLRSIANLYPQISLPALQLSIFQQGQLYEVMNGLSSIRDGQVQLRELVLDIKNGMEITFQLTHEQIDYILMVAKDHVFKSTRAKYMDVMHLEVEKYIKDRATTNGFSQIFGYPMRELVLREVIKIKCSSARAQLRQKIIDSITKASQPLDQATVAIAEKLKEGGASGTDGKPLPGAFALRAAWLRRFAFGYISEAPLASEGPSTPGSSDDGSTGLESRPLKRKRAAKGKKEKEDFWSSFDAEIKKKQEELGSDMKSDKWKVFHGSIVAQDLAQWGPLIGLSRLEPLQVVTPQATAGDTSTSTQSVLLSTGAGIFDIPYNYSEQNMTPARSTSAHYRGLGNAYQDDAFGSGTLSRSPDEPVFESFTPSREASTFGYASMPQAGPSTHSHGAHLGRILNGGAV